MFDLVIRQGQVVTPQGIWQADVAIAGGRIAGLLDPRAGVSAAAEIDAAGLYVLPGLIDAHVHLREPGLCHKETLATGTQAAACGGVTTVLDMPNTLPPVTGPQAAAEKGSLIAGRAHVDVGLFAVLSPESLDCLAALTDCVGVKLFLGPTTGNLAAPGWGELYPAFCTLAEVGLPVVVHAEDGEIISKAEPAARAAGSTYRHFLAARPGWAEVSATERVCRLAAATGASVHIAHVALGDAVPVLARAKEQGWPVTAETCPPYLFLTAADYDAVGTAMKVLPPVRELSDQQALWQGLRNGTVDMIATDHAPHTADEKAAANLWEAPSGAPGVETMLPLLLDAAQRGMCTLSDIVRWCAAAPAARFGLAGKGVIAVGAWADLVLVDLSRPWQIRPESLHSLGRVTPFAGRRGVGAPVLTLLRGEVVARDGEPVGKAQGRWVKPARM